MIFEFRSIVMERS